MKRRIATVLALSAAIPAFAPLAVADAAANITAVAGRERIKITIAAVDVTEQCRVLIDGDSKGLYSIAAGEKKVEIYQVAPAGMHPVEVECGANQTAYSNTLYVDPQNMIFEAVDQAMRFLGIQGLLAIDPVFRSNT